MSTFVNSNKNNSYSSQVLEVVLYLLLQSVKEDRQERVRVVFREEEDQLGKKGIRSNIFIC